MSYKTLILNIEHNIATVTLNRSEKLNSLTYQSFVELDQVIKRLNKIPTLRVVILNAQGTDFCTGLDIYAISKKPSQMLKLLFKWLPGNQNLAQRVVLGWQKLPVPVIAKIQGRCFGGGLQLALGADFRIVDVNASLSIMETRWGLTPDMGASTMLSSLISIDHALQLTHLAQPINAQKAHQINLVTQVTGDLDKACDELVAQLLAQSPDALAANKRLYQTSYGIFNRKVLAKETWHQIRLLLGKNQKIAANNALNEAHLPYHKAKKW